MSAFDPSRTFHAWANVRDPFDMRTRPLASRVDFRCGCRLPQSARSTDVGDSEHVSNFDKSVAVGAAMNWLLFAALVALLLSGAGLIWRRFSRKASRQAVIGSLVLMALALFATGSAVAYNHP